MPLFDPDNPQSEELAKAFNLRARLSETAGFQQLAEAADAAEALGSIHVGAGTDPDDGEAFTLEELENRRVWARILPQEEEGAAWFEGDSGTQDKFEETTWVFIVKIRWQVREVDLNTDGRDGIYNYMWDVTSLLPNQLMAAAHVSGNCLRIRRITRPEVVYGMRTREPAQGDLMMAEFAVLVGDISE